MDGHGDEGDVAEGRLLLPLDASLLGYVALSIGDRERLERRI